jgi:hypothetical protein
MSKLWLGPESNGLVLRYVQVSEPDADALRVRPSLSIIFLPLYNLISFSCCVFEQKVHDKGTWPGPESNGLLLRNYLVGLRYNCCRCTPSATGPSYTAVGPAYDMFGLLVLKVRRGIYTSKRRSRSRRGAEDASKLCMFIKNSSRKDATATENFLYFDGQ